MTGFYFLRVGNVSETCRKRVGNVSETKINMAKKKFSTVMSVC